MSTRDLAVLLTCVIMLMATMIGLIYVTAAVLHP
jgi:hypothetical protein